MTLLEKVNQIYAAVAELPKPSPVFEDLTWVEMAGGPYGGVYDSAQSIVGNVFSRLGSEWDDFKLNPDVFLESPGYVTVIGRYTGAFKETGKNIDARVVHLWKEENGKIYFEQFTDTALFYEAMKKD